MKTIKQKLIVMYLALVLIVMMVSGTYIIFSLKNSEMEAARNQMQLYCEKISEQVVMSFEESRFQSGLDQFSTGDSTSSRIEGNIIDMDGNTLASTAPDASAPSGQRWWHTASCRPPHLPRYRRSCPSPGR